MNKPDFMGGAKIEIYSPPACHECRDRAFRVLIGTTKYYCRRHWAEIPGHLLVEEYEQHMEALRDQIKELEAKNGG